MSRASTNALGITVAAHDDHVQLRYAHGTSAFHHVWLRDNCGCGECRVDQSGERRLFTATIADDIAPVSVEVAGEGALLDIEWNDGHRSRFSVPWLLAHDYSSGPPRRFEPTLWDAARLMQVPTFEHAEVVGTTAGQLAYLEAVREYGVAVVRGTPSREGEVERFAETVGHVRETAFERIHNVRHDPSGYNVAHTSFELKAHTDLPSYHWPPSIQLLHFLVNEATGGESTVTDGWAVVADLRREDPEAFDVLARVPVTFQLFSADEDTYATAPIIQLDTEGRVTTFRFSNQLAQPLHASFEDVGAFYRAYRALGRRIDSDRYKVAFKTVSGDLLTVHGHRVMHGRLAFEPTSGDRHLQDVYMEYDDLMARRRVLLGHHIPDPATGGDA
ncbi:MAG TPA: TauD/TfdA family dioxygenase [Nocardioides sp.]|uniref:TauD/TfdA family dioxygenase n=1 Tax=uncultured Nocardioides sp. TaxID=198441 RepID=UPI002604105C|nr:TauD/TfdA family dioxygenase [uncultured Nocardioides sp.]HRD60352.1 TauD/TfdA family dioxygenase [Nocardioides sp.]HRI96680.1 TauD/TfdA family dioxygenase [Nocardioides sp.]HRK47647.1 TauD/TfdA family dioxygenase [Nocardioides sp.]